MKLLIFAVLLTCCSANAQQPVMETKTDSLEVKKSRREHMRIYYVAPGSFGNNVLSKANKGAFGAGLMVTLVSFSGNHITTGFEFSNYSVEDVSLAANVSSTNISNFYIAYLYRLPIVAKMSLNPRISLGNINIMQRKDNDSYGKQHGFGYGLGTDIDYAFSGNTRVFFGISYNLLKPGTHTVPELKDFYGTLHQLNFSIGIKF